MTDVYVKIIRHGHFQPLPAYKTAGSAGCDVFAFRDVVIYPGSRCLVPTGLFLEIPVGYECQVRSRSGIAMSHGVIVLNSPGTIDSDYRGEVGVLLYNAGDTPFEIRPGDRIAQLVFCPVTQVKFDVVDEIQQTERGSGGWGSTGV